MNLNDLKRLIAPLQRRIFLLLGRAILKTINNAEGTQKVQIVVLNNEIITDVERFQEYGLETYPFTEAEVCTVFLNGNRDHGIALCVHDRRYRPTDLVEGEVALYTDEDSSDFRIHLKRGRIFDIKGDKVTETQDTSKEITTPSETHVNATEHIINSPQVSLGGAAFAGLRGFIDSRFIALFNAHVHANGGGVGNSGVPTAAMSEGNHATAKVKGI